MTPAPPAPRAPDDLLTPPEAAASLAISLKTLRGHVKDGTLPRIIVGRGKSLRHYAFDPADIERFKMSRREFGGAPPCPSIDRKNRRGSPTTFSSKVVVLQDLLDARAAAKRKP